MVDIITLAMAKAAAGGGSGGDMHVTGNLQVDGNITQQGQSYETHAEKIYSKNDYIITRDGAVSGLASGDFSGFQVKKYDGTNDGRLVIDSTGTARVGDVGDEQPLLTRAETADLVNGAPLVWDSTNLKAVSGGTSSYTAGDGISIDDGEISVSNDWAPITLSSNVLSYINSDTTCEYLILSTDKKYCFKVSTEIAGTSGSKINSSYYCTLDDPQDGFISGSLNINQYGVNFYRIYETSYSFTPDAAKIKGYGFDGTVIDSNNISSYYDVDNETVIKPFIFAYNTTNSGEKYVTFVVPIGKSTEITGVFVNNFDGTEYKYVVSCVNINKILRGTIPSNSLKYFTRGKNTYNLQNTNIKLYKRKKLSYVPIS